MPLRVTMIGSLPPHRGVSPYTLDLAGAIASDPDVELDFLAFRSLYPRRFYPGGDPEDGSRWPVDVPNAATRRALRWWNPAGWVLAGLTLRGDVVHAQWWSFPLAPVYLTLLTLARLRRKRVVITVHNAEPHEIGILRRLANRAVLPLAHHIIVHTQSNARTLRRGGHRGAITVVPMGVGPPQFISDDERRDARGALGIDPDATVVLFHGNIRPYKGVETLIAAFRDVALALPQARLIIAGLPWGPEQTLHDEIERHGLKDRIVTRFEYLPPADLLSCIAAADVVVYPYTHFEAQSAAACDALRYGRAIIVSNIGGLPELVRNPLAVVPPGRPQPLANTMLDVLRDPALRTSLEADARAVGAALAWPDVAARTRALYRAQTSPEIDRTGIDAIDVDQAA